MPSIIVSLPHMSAKQADEIAAELECALVDIYGSNGFYCNVTSVGRLADGSRTITTVSDDDAKLE